MILSWRVYDKSHELILIDWIYYIKINSYRLLLKHPYGYGHIMENIVDCIVFLEICHIKWHIFGQLWSLSNQIDVIIWKQCICYACKWVGFWMQFFMNRRTKTLCNKCRNHVSKDIALNRCPLTQLVWEAQEPSLL